MILYHGINTDLSEIDLKKSRPDKDFGRAFISPILGNKLSKWQSADASLQVGGSPIVQKYEFDESLLHGSSLNVKIFNGTSVEWAKFIIKNRNTHSKREHNYDIVVGPVADDGVVYQMNLYAQHLLRLLFI